MKLSISLRDSDVEFLDSYAHSHAVASRSAAVQAAIALLRALELSDDYAAAWLEWEASDDMARWDSVAADGLSAP